MGGEKDRVHCVMPIDGTRDQVFRCVTSGFGLSSLLGSFTLRNDERWCTHATYYTLKTPGQLPVTNGPDDVFVYHSHLDKFVSLIKLIDPACLPLPKKTTHLISVEHYKIRYQATNGQADTNSECAYTTAYPRRVLPAMLLEGGWLVLV
jgi:hypothetical protein